MPSDLETLRQRQIQAIGAGISRRDWHAVEQAYNQMRDKVDEWITIAARDGFEAQHGLNDVFPGDPVKVRALPADQPHLSAGSGTRAVDVVPLDEMQRLGQQADAVMDDASEAVEAVARALFEYNAICEDSDPDEMFEGAPLWTQFEDEAAVAIATLRPMIVEQCAKVAEDHSREAHPGERVFAFRITRNIAAAIRGQADV